MRAFTLLAIVMVLLGMSMGAWAQSEETGAPQPPVEEIVEDIEEISEDYPAESEAGAQQMPQMSPEEFEQRQKEMRAVVEYVRAHIPENCQAELDEMLSTPPEQQRDDQLSADCKKLVESSVQAYHQAKAKADKASEPKSSKAPAKEKAPKATKAKKEVPSEWRQIGIVLLSCLAPIVAFVGYAYIRAQQRAVALAQLKEEDPAQYAAVMARQKRETESVDMSAKQQKGRRVAK